MVTVSQDSTTFTITESLTTGNFADGPAWVYLPSGTATLTAMTPAASTQDGYAINGAMLTPSPLYAADNQGFDERMDDQLGGTQTAMTANYDAAVNVALSLPLTLSAGDVVLKSVYHDFGTVSTELGKGAARNGLFDEMNALFVVDWVPGAEEPAPAAVGWTGRTMAKIQYADTLANMAAALPSRSLTGIAQQTVADVISWINYFDPGYGLSYGATTGNARGYQSLMVNNTAVSGYSNYGRYKAAIYHNALWHLIGDTATQAQKETLLKWVISVGIQNAFPYLQGQVSFGGNGAHHQFHQCVGLFAIAHTTGHGLNFADFLNYAQGNLFGDIFKFTATEAARCTFHTNTGDPGWPRTYHEHTITSVNGTTIQTNVPVQSFQVYGHRIVRKSDSAEAIVTSQGNIGSSFTIDAQPGSPFQIGDVVNFQRDPAPSAGDYDWNINKSQSLAQDRFDLYVPSRDTGYRSLQEATGIGPCVDIGAWDAGLDYAWQYVKQSFTANEPSATNEWPKHVYDLNGVNMNEEMWENLWPSIESGMAGTGTNPVISSTTPADNATDVATGTTITLTFDKAVQLVSGNIVLRENNGGWADLETFDVSTGNGDGTPAGTVAVSNNRVTITPGSALTNGREYAVRIAATCIDDTESPANSFAGIADDTTLSFTTVSSVPSVSGATITLNMTVG